MPAPQSGANSRLLNRIATELPPASTASTAKAISTKRVAFLSEVSTNAVTSCIPLADLP
jgi:hypothetical protein